MSVEITEAQVLELMRIAIVEEVAALRPMIREQVVEEMAFVSETEGLKILPIQGKDPLRTFRRLMNDLGVHRIRLRGEMFYKRAGDNSVAAALEKVTVKPAPRKKGTPTLKVMEGSIAS
jgi:hypothetical protein